MTWNRRPDESLQRAPESLFWYWIEERHQIHLKKMAGLPKPWTHDPVLQTYKFTNPFRENDRGTVWLREHFLEPHDVIPHESNCLSHEVGQDDDCDCWTGARHLELLAFNICWYRMFNWTGTGQLLGWMDDWNPAAVQETLEQAMLRGEQVFTGAHMVRSKHGRLKIPAVIDICSELYDACTKPSGSVYPETLPMFARRTKRLEAVFNRLMLVGYIGKFMSYEMVTDMRHTKLLNDATDIMTWASAGVGAKRGLLRLGLPSNTPEEELASMRVLLSRAPKSNDLPVFEMRDIEHSLCEFDKYCRARFGEGRPRSFYPGAA